MPSPWTPLVLLLVVVAGETRTWRDRARRAAPSPWDRGSFRLNNLLGWGALALGLSSGWALRGAGWAAVPPAAAWAGAGLALAGTALRAWAITVLGDCFTLTIQVRPGQPLIQRGPYRWLRHPSYAGGDLALLGVGLSAGNWVSPLLYLGPWLAAHVYRIGVEERALAQVLGEPYRAYQRRTWRLLPFVW